MKDIDSALLKLLIKFNERVWNNYGGKEEAYRRVPIAHKFQLQAAEEHYLAALEGLYDQNSTRTGTLAFMARCGVFKGEIRDVEIAYHRELAECYVVTVGEDGAKDLIPAHEKDTHIAKAFADRKEPVLATLFKPA
jgi:hypothetical protein